MAVQPLEERTCEGIAGARTGAYVVTQTKLGSSRLAAPEIRLLPAPAKATTALGARLRG